jgi:hypothetical protein
VSDAPPPRASPPGAESEDALEATFGWFLDVLERRLPDGRLRFPTAVLFDFITAMLLSFGADLSTLPRPLVTLVGSFADRAGVRPGMSKAETEAAFRAYLADHPLDPELVFELERGLREELAGRDRAEAGSRFVRFLAERVVRSDPQAAPAQGQARGGLGAQLAFLGRQDETPSRPRARDRRRGPRRR